MNSSTDCASCSLRFAEQCEAMQQAVDAWYERGDETASPPALVDEGDILTKIEASWNKHSRTFRDVVNLLSTTDNPAALPLAYRLQTTLR